MAEENKTEKVEKKSDKIVLSKKVFYGTIAVIVIAAVILAVVYVVLPQQPATPNNNGNGSSLEPGTTNTNQILVLNDKRCKDCDISQLLLTLQTVFPDMQIKQLDYSDADGKALFDSAELTLLPAVLFDDSVKDQNSYSQVVDYLDQAGKYTSLRIGAFFDPTAEICDNGIDDDNNGKIDCADPYCEGAWVCMEKTDKPTVELFVMAYCPYGTQTEKGILPVIDLLGDKIDFSVKFCDYAMHGQQELNEQLVQYCIESEQNEKFLPYLKCFLADGNSTACLTQGKIDSTKFNACVKATDEKFKVTELFEDESTWINGLYPLFPVFQEDVDKYFVGGSPTLIVNGLTAETGRSPAALLETICFAFSTQPAECSEILSTTTPTSGFGFEEGTASTSDATCG